MANADLKRKIREGAEVKEREFYAHRALADWLEAPAAPGTGASKPFLETAPWLIANFSQKNSDGQNGEKLKNCYPIESTFIATGILISALHQMELVTFAHASRPMKSLNDILGRPENVKPFLLEVAGYPAEDARLPDIHRKPLSGIASFLTDWQRTPLHSAKFAVVDFYRSRR